MRSPLGARQGLWQLGLLSLVCFYLVSLSMSNGVVRAAEAAKVSKAFPDGELRAICYAWPKENDRTKAVPLIEKQFDQLQAAGFNSVFVWTSSLYLAALERPDLHKLEPKAAWDVMAETLKAAKTRQLQVHAWYSPWIYKDKNRAIELLDHPEWAAVSATGAADSRGVCFIRPEVRQFELDLLAKLIDRYPDLVGIHIEEPGFNWKADYCFCDYCREFCRPTLGLDIRRDPAAAKPQLNNLAASMSSDFIVRLRTLLQTKRPEMWLSANGSANDNTDWYIGRDWSSWAHRGYLDFYVPQVYTKSVPAFRKKVELVQGCLDACPVATAIAVTWSSIYPARQTPENIQAEIAAARALGAKGFLFFHHQHFRDEHFQAVREAVRGKKDAAGVKP